LNDNFDKFVESALEGLTMAATALCPEIFEPFDEEAYKEIAVKRNLKHIWG
jgi:hypothetical protein